MPKTVNGEIMTDRANPRVLDFIAHGLGPPCLAASFLFYFFVTWAPTASPKPELFCGSLLLAGVGASMITMRNASRRLRVTGATTMCAALVAIVGLGLV
jgi:hypothetical protein